MNRIDRLTAMILMLQGHRVITAEKIAEHFEISVRTVYRDIAALGEAGVPITAEAGVGYALMRGYHMPPIMFTETEAAALSMSGELAERFGDESLKRSMRDALMKVRAALPEERKDYLSRLGNSLGVWEYGGTGKTEESSLMPVQEAVVRRRCLQIDYNTRGVGEITRRVVEPLGVVFYAHRWHLIGWCRLREAVRDFRLDRMAAWEVLPEIFHGHEDFSLLDFLDHDVDPKEMIPVSLDCESWALDRVLADMPAQLVEQGAPVDGRVKIEALAYSLDWLVGWLLGLGKAAMVHSPQELRDKLATAAREIATTYEN